MAPKTVLITGCGPSNAGAALASEFRRRGHRVFATARDTARIQTLCAADDITALELDVTSPSSIEAAVATVRESVRGGGIDILVNNAAIFSQMPLADVQLQDARRMFEANVWGPLALTQAFLPLLMGAHAAGPSRTGSEESSRGREGGLVVNVASISAFMCPP
ncbi:NAD(P)-binding protein [Xylariaceae sp. FL0016]|nr:NAD(P)-binding protein [Xylariaceae sp. FL0016]